MPFDEQLFSSGRDGRAQSYTVARYGHVDMLHSARFMSSHNGVYAAPASGSACPFKPLNRVRLSSCWFERMAGGVEVLSPCTAKVFLRQVVEAAPRPQRREEGGYRRGRIVRHNTKPNGHRTGVQSRENQHVRSWSSIQRPAPSGFAVLREGASYTKQLIIVVVSTAQITYITIKYRRCVVIPLSHTVCSRLGQRQVLPRSYCIMFKLKGNSSYRV